MARRKQAETKKQGAGDAYTYQNQAPFHGS